MGACDRQMPSTASIKRPTATVRVLLLVMSVQPIVHVAGSSLCDRCETEEIRALRRYYMTLNISSWYNFTRISLLYSNSFPASLEYFTANFPKIHTVLQNRRAHCITFEQYLRCIIWEAVCYVLFANVGTRCIILFSRPY